MIISNLLLIALVIYFTILVGIVFFVSRKLKTEEDFLVGGRQFNLFITTLSLFATWFGAGTLITATDEIAREGLKATALEPYGAGTCLLLAGLFFAKPLWKMRIMTYGDLFREKFGPRTELISVFINIPVYVGWIAVQIISLSHIFMVFFPLPLWFFVLAIATLACTLTLSGGIWSVSFTDSFQLIIIIIGLFYLLFTIIGIAPNGLNGLIESVSPTQWVLIPSDKKVDLFNWIGVFCISALGNMTGQDLGQRIFSARSAKVAQWGCLLAGLGYITIGSVPVLLGLTAHSTLGDFEGSVIPSLIKNYLDPISGVIILLTIISAVISTITSALLAPSSMLSHNFLKNIFTNTSSLLLCKISVVAVTALSVLITFAGEDVYSLLENSYAIGFVGFFAPVTIALYSKKLNEKACLITMTLAIALWLLEFTGLKELPYSLIAVILSYPIYFVSYSLIKKRLIF